MVTDQPSTDNSGTDEDDSVHCRGSQFACTGGAECIPHEFYCDGGQPDCTDGSDELADCSVSDVGLLYVLRLSRI
jgi:hypothetical protein